MHPNQGKTEGVIPQNEPACALLESLSISPLMTSDVHSDGHIAGFACRCHCRTAPRCIVINAQERGDIASSTSSPASSTPPLPLNAPILSIYRLPLAHHKSHTV